MYMYQFIDTHVFKRLYSLKSFGVFSIDWAFQKWILMFLLYPFSSGILLYAHWYCMLRIYLFKLLGRTEIKRINFLSNPVEFYFHVDFFSFPFAFLLIKVNWDSEGG